MTTRPWLVTGAAGFLGSHVVDCLLDQGTSVVAVDNIAWGRIENLSSAQRNPRFTLAIEDIRDQPALNRLICRHKPKAVVHLAALHFIPAAEANPAEAIDINVRGTQSVLTACRDANVERLWFASTGDVYAPSDGPLDEDAVVAPFNIYGLSKLMGEQLIQLQSKRQPTARYVVGRLFNLYGSRETNPHILPEIIKQCREQPDLPLQLGNLWPRRDLVPVTDAARAVVETIRRAPEGVSTVNVATGESHSMQDVIDAIGELKGRSLIVETDPSKVRSVERPHLQAEVTKLRKMIGWTPHCDLHRGLRELLEAERLLGKAA